MLTLLWSADEKNGASCAVDGSQRREE